MIICSTCKHRVKEIIFVGFSTVKWTGKWQCDRQYTETDWKLHQCEDGIFRDESAEPITEGCPEYTPERSRGQTALEAFL